MYLNRSTPISGFLSPASARSRSHTAFCFGVVGMTIQPHRVDRYFSYTTAGCSAASLITAIVTCSPCSIFSFSAERPRIRAPVPSLRLRVDVLDDPHFHVTRTRAVERAFDLVSDTLRPHFVSPFDQDLEHVLELAVPPEVWAR